MNPNGDPGYVMRPQDAGRVPIKVRLKHTRGGLRYVWRCRRCNAGSHRFYSPGKAIDEGMAHYWERCVTQDDLDVIDAREAMSEAVRAYFEIRKAAQERQMAEARRAPIGARIASRVSDVLGDLSAQHIDDYTLAR